MNRIKKWVCEQSKINWQEMYHLFPELTFEGTRDFGKYVDFNGENEHKIYDMVITKGNKKFILIYRQYQDEIKNIVAIRI